MLLVLTTPQRGNQSGCASEQQPPGYQQPFSATRWLLPGYSSILACHSGNVQHTACAAKFRLKMQMRSDVDSSPELFIQRIHMLGTTNRDSQRGFNTPILPGQINISVLKKYLET